MKKLSKLLALLLALAMVLCLVACTADNKGSNNKDDKGSSDVEEKEETDAEKVLGKWTCRFDLSDAISKELADSLGDDALAPDSAFYLNLILDFDDEELVLKAEVDEDSLGEYMDELIDNMIDYLYDLAADQGISKKDFEAEIEKEYGMPLDEYISEEVDKLIEDAADEMNFKTTFCYEVNEKKGYIYIGEDEDELDSKDEAMEYSFEGEKLVVTAVISDGEEIDVPRELSQYGIDLPWTFKKK